MKVKSESEIAQSCPTLSDPMDCSLPGSSVHGIFQAKVLEWGAVAFSTVDRIKFLKYIFLYFSGIVLLTFSNALIKIQGSVAGIWERNDMEKIDYNSLLNLWEVSKLCEYMNKVLGWVKTKENILL